MIILLILVIIVVLATIVQILTISGEIATERQMSSTSKLNLLIIGLMSLVLIIAFMEVI
jgi:uncharacterized protein YhhL (DUF1145 family)